MSMTDEFSRSVFKLLNVEATPEANLRLEGAWRSRPMKIARAFFVLLLILAVMAPGRAFAGQQHIVEPGAIAAATEDQATAADADRATVRQALARPEVQSAAAKLGISMERLDSAVGTMTGADLQRAASTARQVNDQLVGGASTVTISTTTIIIVLLVIILIVVIAD